MPLLVYGINHQSAPIAIREKLAFDAMAIPNALSALIEHNAVSEAVILSTCNRTEIYANLTAYFPLQQWLQQQKGLGHLDLSAYDYAYHDIDAIRHIMRVASGLDSMILGEPQIFGQIKQAFQLAQDAGAIGDLFLQLFPTVFETSKHVRTHTDICAHPVSLAYAIMQIAKQTYQNLSNHTALLVGSGEMIELVATHFHQHGLARLIVANRSIDKTQHLAEKFRAETVSIAQLPQLLTQADIVVSATRSQLPIIGKGTLETTMALRDNRPLLIFDLAVPRDIEPEAAALSRIQLFNIDDLQKIITDNLQNRRQAAIQAESMIERKASQFMQELQTRNAHSIITDFRKRLESMRDETLEKARDQLQAGIDPHIVLEQFARTLTNKILHQPTVKLREAASEAQTETLQLAKHLFELE